MQQMVSLLQILLLAQHVSGTTVPIIRLIGLFCLQRKHLAMWVSLNIVFHGEVLLASRPTPKLEDHPSSAVRDCLFNLFAATLHIGGRSSNRNLRTRHAVVTDPLITACDELTLHN